LNDFYLSFYIKSSIERYVGIWFILHMDNSEILDRAERVWEIAAYEIERLRKMYDKEAFCNVVRVLADHEGRVFTCGVGTSGIAARKLAHTLSCIEIPSMYLNPADAVHGALGAIQKNDIVFLLSKGGGTREIVQLIPSLKEKHAVIVAVTERVDSPLAKASDHVLLVRVEKEADSFNMLATTSTLTVVAMFDALCIAVMELTGYSQEKFAVIHPGGAVGERLLKKS
jgi:D-arabinose 5-phosphate isomerase GutQ